MAPVVPPPQPTAAAAAHRARHEASAMQLTPPRRACSTCTWTALPAMHGGSWRGVARAGDKPAGDARTHPTRQTVAARQPRALLHRGGLTATVIATVAAVQVPAVTATRSGVTTLGGGGMVDDGMPGGRRMARVVVGQCQCRWRVPQQVAATRHPQLRVAAAVAVVHEMTTRMGGDATGIGGRG